MCVYVHLSVFCALADSGGHALPKVKPTSSVRPTPVVATFLYLYVALQQKYFSARVRLLTMATKCYRSITEWCFSITTIYIERNNNRD